MTAGLKCKRPFTVIVIEQFTKRLVEIQGVATVIFKNPRKRHKLPTK
jgi:hypothetical protein